MGDFKAAHIYAQTRTDRRLNSKASMTVLLAPHSSSPRAKLCPPCGTLHFPSKRNGTAEPPPSVAASASNATLPARHEAYPSLLLFHPGARARAPTTLSRFQCPPPCDLSLSQPPVKKVTACVRPPAAGAAKTKAGAREKSSTAVRSETLARAPQRTAQMRIGPSRARRAHLPPPPVLCLRICPRLRANVREPQAGTRQSASQPTDAATALSPPPPLPPARSPRQGEATQESSAAGAAACRPGRRSHPTHLPPSPLTANLPSPVRPRAPPRPRS